MSVAIKNLTSRPVFVSLNSGTNLRLSAGEVSSPVPDVELKGNAKFDKLVAQRAIAAEPVANESVEEPAGKATAPAREKRGAPSGASSNPGDELAARATAQHPQR
jgi:hypothetical protein